MVAKLMKTYQSQNRPTDCPPLIENMYSNLFNGVRRQAYSFQTAGNIGIFTTTFLGNL